jgi:PAS domain-containing protein
MMELLRNHPQTAMAILAGLLLGGLILCLLFLLELYLTARRNQQKTNPVQAAHNVRALFLFKGRDLIQTCDMGETMIQQIQDLSGLDGDAIGQDDWKLVTLGLLSHFSTLPEDPVWAEGSGQIWLDPDRSDDSERLLLDWWEGHIRLTLIGPGPDRDMQISRSGAGDEAGWLRQAVTGAPYPIWQSDSAGKVLWANTAYRDLVSRFAAQETGTDSGKDDPDNDAAFFRLPFNPDQESASFRMSVTPAGAAHPYWFDVRSLRLAAGWMNYATDVNAVVNAEIAQRNFVQTLTKTFAQLSIGLAIFDRKRQLALFNPALIDLTALPAEFLSSRPNLLSFFDRLRDQQMMPEPKNYRSWRDQIADLVAAADNGQYRETWSLPSGLTYRISGRPHPDGAVAFLFEDISAEISLTRRFRSQLELGQSVLNTLDQCIAVFSSSGVLAFSNVAYRKMWNIDSDCSFTDISITDAARHWQTGSMPTPVWGDLRDFVVQFGERADWQADVTLRDGRIVQCQVIPMSGGATLVVFQPTGQRIPVQQGDLLSSPA